MFSNLLIFNKPIRIKLKNNTKINAVLLAIEKIAKRFIKCINQFFLKLYPEQITKRIDINIRLMPKWDGSGVRDVNPLPPKKEFPTLDGTIKLMI
tara:strand:- start:333 stop:617 length:285 start_codon:yes stop_codon:yes gene_type:complete